MDNKTKDHLTFEYATFDRRMLASSLDIIISTLLLYPIMGVMSFILYGEDSSLDKFFREHGRTVSADTLWNFILQEHLIIKWLIIQLSVLLAMAAYFIYFWIYKGATPGKLIAKCRIVDVNTNQPPSRKQCVGRFFGCILSVLPIMALLFFLWYSFSSDTFQNWYIAFVPLSCVGFFIQTLTKKKQALHDFVSGTAVIKLINTKKKPSII